MLFDLLLNALRPPSQCSSTSFSMLFDLLLNALRPPSQCTSTFARHSLTPISEGWYCTTHATQPMPSNSVEGGQCTAGTYCPGGSSAPINCTAGYYCSNNRLALPTALCNQGRLLLDPTDYVLTCDINPNQPRVQGTTAFWAPPNIAPLTI